MLENISLILVSVTIFLFGIYGISNYKITKSYHTKHVFDFSNYNADYSPRNKRAKIFLLVIKILAIITILLLILNKYFIY